ncbi:MAG: type II secretion system protein [Planctomycetes bacterium]|nr:type II secretion system protein [Planctomycetota bacterium]
MLRRNHKGFTIVELLVALMVTSIIFTAVATLVYAIGAANDVTDDTREKQAKVRYATLRIGELIRYSKLVYESSENGLVFWNIDSNNNNQVDNDELVYVDAVTAGSGYIELRIRDGLGDTIVVLSECSNVDFTVDPPVPWSRYAGVSFGLLENGVVRRYQISGSLRNWAGNLLDESGNIVSDDD